MSRIGSSGMRASSRTWLDAYVLGAVLAACSSEQSVGAVATDASVATNAADAARLDAGSGETAPHTQIDRDHLKETGTQPLDYADPALWACRPGNDPNECHANLDSTEVTREGELKVVPHVRAQRPAFDCFYLYPTVAVSGGGNMRDFSDITPVLDPLLSQAARFNRVCEVYAPLYRQVSLETDAAGGIQRDGDPQLARDDVRAAFQHYVEVLSRGRKFVILGHSQGAALGVELLSRTVDKDPALRERFISAVLLGAAPTVALGRTAAGSFQNIPLCSAPGQVGCLIAYDTYDVKAPPDPQTARFGANKEPGREVACTEPSPLASNHGNYRGSYFAMHVHNPLFELEGYRPEDIDTPFLLYRDYFTSRCVHNEESTYLELSASPFTDDVRQMPPYRNAELEQAGWGLHLSDFQPALDDLIEAVDQQAKAALAR